MGIGLRPSELTYSLMGKEPTKCATKVQMIAMIPAGVGLWEHRGDLTHSHQCLDLRCS